MKLRLVFFLACLFPVAFAATTPVVLEDVPVSSHDLASIRRGAKDFSAQCMVCHSLKYLTHNKIANEAGITLARMPKDDQKWWFGTAPPDLTLTTRVHGADWVYTYLHVFYKDPTVPSGNKISTKLFWTAGSIVTLVVTLTKLLHA